jgi:hypothetical protein
MMERIYDTCWKNDREYRSDRSFIREFWTYQNAYGPDNYNTFQPQEQKNKQAFLRGNHKQKKLIYQGCFMEREAAIVLCQQLQSLRDNCLLQLSYNSLEDQQFDRFLGIDEGGEAPMSEQELRQRVEMPFMTVEQEKDLLMEFQGSYKPQQDIL